MKYIPYILIFWTLLLISFASANGQKLSDSELKAFLTTATEKTSEYSNVFKNLTVEEIKTFETFDKDGKMTITITVAKQVGKMESTYTVKGDQLVIMLSGSTGTGRVITIKKLTDKELIWVEPNGKTAEFKRN